MFRGGEIGVGAFGHVFEAADFVIETHDIFFEEVRPLLVGLRNPQCGLAREQQRGKHEDADGGSQDAVEKNIKDDAADFVRHASYSLLSDGFLLIWSKRSHMARNFVYSC